MKISKTARQNYILLALAGIFFLLAKGGVDDIAKNGVEGFGIFFVMIGGLAMVCFLIALIVRIWDAE
jgi:hypothetical protein